MLNRVSCYSSDVCEINFHWILCLCVYVINERTYPDWLINNVWFQQVCWTNCVCVIYSSTWLDLLQVSNAITRFNRLNNWNLNNWNFKSNFPIFNRNINVQAPLISTILGLLPVFVVESSKKKSAFKTEYQSSASEVRFQEVSILSVRSRYEFSSMNLVRCFHACSSIQPVFYNFTTKNKHFKFKSDSDFE